MRSESHGVGGWTVLSWEGVTRRAGAPRFWQIAGGGLESGDDFSRVRIRRARERKVWERMTLELAAEFPVRQGDAVPRRRTGCFGGGGWRRLVGEGFAVEGKREEKNLSI